jgi:hypothetical protein
VKQKNIYYTGILIGTDTKYENFRGRKNTLHYVAGIQGDEIGDVKFNGDGDGVGRYSVYQYQHITQGPNSKSDHEYADGVGRLKAYQYQQIAQEPNRESFHE